MISGEEQTRFVYREVLFLPRRAQLVTLDDFARICEAWGGHAAVYFREQAGLGTEIV